MDGRWYRKTVGVAGDPPRQVVILHEMNGNKEGREAQRFPVEEGETYTDADLRADEWVKANPLTDDGGKPK